VRAIPRARHPVGGEPEQALPPEPDSRRWWAGRLRLTQLNSEVLPEPLGPITATVSSLRERQIETAQRPDTPPNRSE